MTPEQMIHEGIKALRRTENGQISYQSGAAVAQAWAALAGIQWMIVPSTEETAPPPMDLAAAAKLDTDRPGVFWQTGNAPGELHKRCQAWAGEHDWARQCSEYEGHDGEHTFHRTHP